MNPSVGAADISRFVEKSVNSVSAFGAKSSVHSLVPEGNPLGGLLLSPPNPLTLGFGGDPIGATDGVRLSYFFYFLSYFLLPPL